MQVPVVLRAEEREPLGLKIRSAVTWRCSRMWQGFPVEKTPSDTRGIGLKKIRRRKEERSERATEGNRRGDEMGLRFDSFAIRFLWRSWV